ncbi:MAG: flagellar export chaperone FliS [Dethiobacter sp.]|nr:flagellar export chaperone FliS [Dethiobacter sp.]
MAMSNPYLAYQQQSVLTASPGELTLMLFNGCLKFLGQAEGAMARQDIQGAHNALLRVQDIVVELMVTLDPQYEVSQGLMALYDYLRRRLLEANLRKDPAIVKECLGLATELRDTWAEAVKLSRGQAHGAG